MNRFLADENVPRPSILLLRDEGVEIEAVGEIAPGASDEKVLAHARKYRQVLVTFDRDFGDLIYRQGAQAPLGVIHLRFTPISPEEPAHVVLRLIHSEEVVLVGQYTVLESEAIRQRSLPRPV